ncbi:MAG: hypothetical protein GY862_33405 [Gammaproteobacteria bacterium]|nr:hypothetical protein [Gammaproteobacteria bacterium]
MPINRGLPSAPQKPAALAKLRSALQNMALAKLRSALQNVQHALNLMAVSLRLESCRSEHSLRHSIFNIRYSKGGCLKRKNNVRK